MTMIMATAEDCPLDLGAYGGNPISVRRWLLPPEHLNAIALMLAGSKPSFNASPWVTGSAAEASNDAFPLWVS